jgi:translation elongation factor EF-1alpha
MHSGHRTQESPFLRKGVAMAEVEIGKITHYFSKIGVAAIEITSGTLSVGDTIHVKGHTSDFTQKIESMQLDNQPVQQATVGQNVGFKTVDHARIHDAVYKVTPE